MEENFDTKNETIIEQNNEIEKENNNKEKVTNKKNIVKRNSKSKKKEKNKRKYFTISYFVLIALILGLCLFDTLSPISKQEDFIIAIILLVLTQALFILMLVDNLIFCKNKPTKILSYFVFLGNALLLLLRLFITSQYSVFILFIYNSILAVYYIAFISLKKTKHPHTKVLDKKIQNILLILFAMFLILVFDHSYVDTGKFMLLSLIPTGIYLVIFSILCFTVFKETFKKFAPKIWSKIGVGFIALILLFCYGFVTIDIINSDFSPKPTKLECEIVRKYVSGGRHSHQYLCVIINDKETDIEVSAELYREKEVNDTIKVNYYLGALNLPFYENAE